MFAAGDNPWFAVSLVVVIAIAFITGWFVAIIPAWLFFGPILFGQGQKNGGPFEPGDTVYIIAGQRSGNTAKVYARWQHETVRVDLGGNAKSNYTDIFAAYQLLRVNADNQNAVNRAT
jgi:hypothetical protein